MSVFASGQWAFIANFGSAGKIETCRAHSDFCQQNRRSQESKTGVWSAGLIFLPHFRVHLSIICCSLWNLRERRPFSIKRIVPPRGGASGARLFWLNYSILNAHRAQFSMTIRTTFKWTSADWVGEGRAEVDEAYLSWRYVPRLFDHARYGSFSLRLSCASSRFHTVPSSFDLCPRRFLCFKQSGTSELAASLML